MLRVPRQLDRKPVGIIEAKKEGVTLSNVADQSGQYAEKSSQLDAPSS